MTRKQQLIEIIAGQVIGRLYEQASETDNEYSDFEIKQTIESGVETKLDSVTDDLTQEDTDAIVNKLTNMYITIYKEELQGWDLYDYTTFIENLDTEEFLNPDPEAIIDMFKKSKKQ